MRLPKLKIEWPSKGAARDEDSTPSGSKTPTIGTSDERVGRRRGVKAEGWALTGVLDNVTFAGDRMIAWYLADPQTWSFRSVPEGEALIRDNAAVLAELVGTTIHGRVTSRPYPVHHWAKKAWDNAPDPQPGFAEMMRRDQMHMAAHSQADKLVYYGIDLGARPAALKWLSRALDGAAEREREALSGRLNALTALMRSGGMSARPATGREMEWLLARSFALGCKVPVPASETEERYVLGKDDLDEWVTTSDWTAQPLAASTQMTTSVNAKQTTRHVVVLTFGRMTDIAIPEAHEPWMAKADQLGFDYEMSFRVTPRTPEQVQKEMTKVANLVDGQMAHWTVEHAKRPPKQLSRQAARAADVEDEMRSSFTGMSTRTKGWYRIAVSGATEAEALERAAQVEKLYSPQIKLVRELGQYALAREFVPGEPLASNAHTRHFPVLKVAAGMPTITSEVGDRRGFHIAETGGVVGRAVLWDPWYLPEVMESSGLVPIVGTQGSGKSTLMGLIIYKSILSGVYGVGMDPAGRMHRMLQLPEMRPLARSVNLLGSQPGTLSPYAVVPEPNRELVRAEAAEAGQDFREKLGLAHAAAESTRRDLVGMTALWCIPYEMNRDKEVRRRLRRAITAVAPGRPINVVGRVIESYAKRFGYGVVRDFTGHGIGTAFHTGLVIPHYDAAPLYDTVIEPGMTFTIEPMLSLGTPDCVEWDDGWTAVTADGRRSAQFEHTLLVTERGAEVLTLPE